MDTANQRVMVFEDDFLLAGTLADVLGQIGCDVVVCVGAFDQAMDAANSVQCDLAVVDLKLRGILAYPVLDRLLERGIPFIMATSVTHADIPAFYRQAPCISKPYDVSELQQAIAQLRSASVAADSPGPFGKLPDA